MSYIILNNRTKSGITKEEITLLYNLASERLRSVKSPILSGNYVQYASELISLVDKGILASYIPHGDQDFEPEIVMHPFIFAAVCRDIFRYTQQESLSAMKIILSGYNHELVTVDNFLSSKEYIAFLSRQDAYPKEITNAIKGIPIHGYERPVVMENMSTPEQFTRILQTVFFTSETHIEL